MKKLFITLVLFFTMATLFAVDIQSKQITIDNNQIHYYEVVTSNDKPNLIMLTGIATTANFWPKDFINSLSKNYNLYILDYRGFNTKQDTSKLDYSIKNLANDTNLFIDKLKLQNLYILGWSMGGAVALQTVFDHKHDFNKLYLISPAMPLAKDADSLVKQKSPPILKTKKDIYNFVFNNNLYNYNSINLDKERSRFINPDITKLFPSDTVYAKQKIALYSWVDNNPNTLKDFTNLNINTYIFMAKNDHILNIKNSQKTLDLVKNKPNFHTTYFDHSGHAINWDYSKDLSILINNFRK